MIVPVMWKQRRIPTLIALLTLVIGLSVGLVAIQSPTLPFLRANPEIKPDQVEITNITDTSFVVSWITVESVPGLIKYGQSGSTELVARDTRDTLTGDPGAYHTHWVKVSGLTPSTSYSFKIQSSTKIFDNNGSSYTVTTAPVLKGEPRPVDAAYGTVIDSSGTPAAGAIVYLRATDLTPQSALVDSTGEWVISLSTVRSQQLDKLAVYDPQQFPLDLYVQAGPAGASTVAVLTGNDSPVSEITLGQNYDLRSLQPPTDTTDSSHKSRFNFIPPLGAVPASTADTIIIWNPQPDESLATDQPLFLGSAPPDTELTITVESTSPITGTVTTDDRGYWQWNPSQPLSLGEHIITIFYTTPDGERIEAIRNFTVLAAESSPLPALESSPSATLSPTVTATSTPTPSVAPIGGSGTVTPTPSRTPTPTPTILATSTPTPRLTTTPTSTITVTTTLSPTPTLITETGLTPTPTPAVPVTGISLPTLTLTAVGIFILAFGAILLL